MDRSTTADFSAESPNRFVVITLQNAGSGASARAGSTPRGYGPISQYSVNASASAAARAIARDYDLSAVREWPIPQLGVHCIVFRIDGEQTQAEMLDRLQVDARVDSAQPLNSFSTLSAAYNDRYVGLQYSLSAMGVLQAHEWSRGEGVRIAVVDTAPDLGHPDLARRKIKLRDYTGLHRSVAEHGTAVTGVIAAQANNRSGIVGVAPEAQVYALAACWPDPADATRAACNSFTLAAALTGAIELGANVVNLSLGGPSDPLLRRLVEYGVKRGMIFVCAVPPDHAVGFPCEAPGVIAVDVAGSESSDRSALLAPGVDVLTLTPHDSYDFLSGSSLAAANVSGAIALLLSRDHSLPADQIRARLSSTAGPGASINICAALAEQAADVRSRCTPDGQAASADPSRREARGWRD